MGLPIEENFSSYSVITFPCTSSVKNDIVAIETLKGELVASGNSLLTSDEILEADSGFAVNVSKVFMKPDTYPRFWK